MTVAAASVGAIAPDTMSVTFTMTSTGGTTGPCTETASAIGDDFTNQGLATLATSGSSHAVIDMATIVEL